MFPSPCLLGGHFRTNLILRRGKPEAQRISIRPGVTEQGQDSNWVWLQSLSFWLIHTRAIFKSSGPNARIQEAVPSERSTKGSPQHRPHWGRAFIWDACGSQCPVSEVTLKATGWGAAMSVSEDALRVGRSLCPWPLHGHGGWLTSRWQGRRLSTPGWGGSRHHTGPTEPALWLWVSPTAGTWHRLSSWEVAGFSPSALSAGLSGHSSHHQALFQSQLLSYFEII